MEWQALAELTNASDPIEEILDARNIQDIDKYLYPQIQDLYAPEYNPFTMKDMTTAVVRVADAIKNKEVMMIEGDYDADGVTSTATFVMGLQELGADVSYHIPLREEGYALSRKGVDIAHERGATLIVTCDNGIAAFDAIDYANSLGIDVVITDHHQPQETIPNAVAIVNPQQVDCDYPTKELSGCGVVFKFLQALNEYTHGNSKVVEKYLDIVCLGTVGDVMKLVGENRLIAKFGLELLAETRNKGLANLLRQIGLDEKEEITIRHIGFNIVPCLNAAGRLGDASVAVEMMLTNSKRQAYRKSGKLNELNIERRELTEFWAKQIAAHIEATPSLLDSKVMLLPFEGVPEGLIGIISGRLKEKYQRPVILLTPLHNNTEIYKGSGRSTPNYNMFEQIMPFSHMTEGFGGHPMACGMSIKRENLETFTQELNEACVLTDEEIEARTVVDYEIEPELLTVDFAEDLLLMAPFGNGNEKPSFVMHNVFVEYPKAMGAKGNHLKFSGQANDESITMIGWSMYKKWQDLGEPGEVDVVFFPEVNEWNNKKTVQLILSDIRVSE